MSEKTDLDKIMADAEAASRADARKLPDNEDAVVRSLYKAKSDRKDYCAYCTTARELTLKEWNGTHPVDENTAEIIMPVGSTLKVVMVSRFGDMGLTRHLDTTHGYSIRVDCDSQAISNIRGDL